jgi:mono/diheme cytochrome c family protein
MASGDISKITGEAGVANTASAKWDAAEASEGMGKYRQARPGKPLAAQWHFSKHLGMPIVPVSIFRNPPCLLAAVFIGVAMAPSVLAGPEGAATLAEKGAGLYARHCAMCHQANGQGVANLFPPLAKSDFLAKHRERSILAVCEGLSGAIEVNGVKYNQMMPPVLLPDAEVAAVLTHVFSQWGNALPAATAEEVAAARGKSRYPTYEALRKQFASPELPPAPAGWGLRVVADFPFNPVRLAKRPSGGDGRLFVLELSGNVWTVAPDGDSKPTLLLAGKDYLPPQMGSPMCMGMTWDRQGRFYVVSNQRDESLPIQQNNVTIWRSEPVTDGGKPELKPWFRTRYPWGIGGFNHGVTHIAQGPDGLLYVSSGSRTDGNEPGKSDRHFKGGEVPLSACLWRFDPKEESPTLHTHARGLRNPYSFAWRGPELWLVDNGPDADAPEELNLITAGAHYGFPFQFSDWTTKPYDYTPDVPDGLLFTHPVKNLGPHGGFEMENKPMATFSPHSSPSGVVFLEGDAYPESDRGTLWLVRFGNLLGKPKDTGFDLLRVKIGPDNRTAAITTVLHPLARPIDLIEWSPGRLFLAEYSLGTSFAAGLGGVGRLLEVRVKK